MHRVAMLVVCLIWGCSAATQATPEKLSESGSGVGRVAFERLRRPDSGVPARPDLQRTAPVLRGEPRLPDVPDEVVEAGTARLTLAVRVLINSVGDVLEVGRSPLSRSTTAGFDDLLDRAVLDAVMQWTFYPSTLRRFEDGKDLDGDGSPDYRVLGEVRDVPSFIDLLFSFEVTDGAATVRVGTKDRFPE